MDCFWKHAFAYHMPDFAAMYAEVRTQIQVKPNSYAYVGPDQRPALMYVNARALVNFKPIAYATPPIIIPPENQTTQTILTDTPPRAPW